MRTAALKQTLRNVAASRRSHSSIDRAALPAPFPCPFIAPFQRSPPPLSLPLSLPLSFSLAPRPVCLFPRRWLPIYFSLYPLRTWSPSRLEGSSPFSSPLSLFLYPAIYLFLSRFLLSLRSVSLFLLLLSAPPASPPSDTAVPPLPRADAATRCNVTFIVPFSFPLFF